MSITQHHIHNVTKVRLSTIEHSLGTDKAFKLFQLAVTDEDGGNHEVTLFLSEKGVEIDTVPTEIAIEPVTE